MNLNKFTEKAQEAVVTAQNLATELNHAEVTPEHLLVALVEQSGGIVPSVLRKLTLDPATRRRRSAGAAQEPAAGVRRRRAVLAAHEADLRLGAGRGAAAAGRVRQHRAPARSRWPPRPAAPPPRSCCSGAASTKDALYTALTQVRGNQRVTSQNPEATYEALARYGRDLTELARKGKLDPVIGRDEEVRRVDPGALPPHQEQPGAHRRARRRQDGDRRRPGAADRPRRRARRAEEQEDLRARHGRAGRRRQVSRRVRGAAEGGPQGDHRVRRARSSSSSTSCTPSSAPAPPKARWTPRRC